MIFNRYISLVRYLTPYFGYTIYIYPKKLPEVSNGKGDDACVKRKKDFSLEKGDDIILLFQAVSVEPTAPFYCRVFRT